MSVFKTKPMRKIRKVCHVIKNEFTFENMAVTSQQSRHQLKTNFSEKFCKHLSAYQICYSHDFGLRVRWVDILITRFKMRWSNSRVKYC